MKLSFIMQRVRQQQSRSKIAIVAGLAVVLLAGAAAGAMHPSKNNVITDTTFQNPAAVTKSSAKTTATDNDTPSQETANAPTTTPDKQGQSTAQSAANKPAAQTPSAPQKTTRPIVNPSIVTQPTPTAPARVTSVLIWRAPENHCSYTATKLYGYSVEFNPQAAPGVMQAHWEYEAISGPPVSPSFPFFPTEFSISSGMFRTCDTRDAGFPYEESTVYRARVHVTAPNDIYSNWITVDPASLR